MHSVHNKYILHMQSDNAKRLRQKCTEVYFRLQVHSHLLLLCELSLMNSIHFNRTLCDWEFCTREKKFSMHNLLMFKLVIRICGTDKQKFAWQNFEFFLIFHHSVVCLYLKCIMEATNILKYHLPALLVSTMNSATSKVCPSISPSPNTFTLLASPISDWPTIILNGLLVTCFPFFFTLTTCSPTSLGVKDIPEGKEQWERVLCSGL